MDRAYFMTTDRLGFSRWSEGDGALASSLWGCRAVTRYICASGVFTEREIADRLALEIANGEKYGVQYWPLFELADDGFVGCCGLRPFGAADGEYELGFHLREEFWGRGYASEAARTAIGYAFNELGAKTVFAGHNPDNAASRKLLGKLGFEYIGDNFYAPTGLYHPSYRMDNHGAPE